ncbi:MAG: hypothetical protein PHC97_03730 [Patescibacteria group bacterium]|nr:hypothetical protein [Patescibacteria group bacterium]
METKQILKNSREIWGKEKLNLSQIIVRLGKVFGDICRWERNAAKDSDKHNDLELKKELGNVIASMICWCDDLGYDPDDCINLALEAQKKFKK